VNWPGWIAILTLWGYIAGHIQGDWRVGFSFAALLVLEHWMWANK